MSADNGIYIAEFGNEYRVAHAQAIYNINHDPDTDDGRNSLAVVDYFNDDRCKSSTAMNIDEALLMAWDLLREYEYDFIPVEYGIQHLIFKHPFAYYLEKSASRSAVREDDIESIHSQEQSFYDDP